MKTPDSILTKLEKRIKENALREILEYNYSIEKRSVWEKIIEIENPNNPMEIFFNEIENFKKEIILNL